MFEFEFLSSECKVIHFLTYKIYTNMKIQIPLLFVFFFLTLHHAEAKKWRVNNGLSAPNQVDFMN